MTCAHSRDAEGYPLPAAQSAIDDYVGRIVHLAQKHEFATFRIGTHLKPDVPDDVAVELKRDINQRVALAVCELLPDREPTRNSAEAIFLLHYPQHRVDVELEPVFVCGRYRKFARDLPHSKWRCLRCRGKGCNKCGHTGVIYPTSVQEIIAEPLLEAMGGTLTKMHATGRQDVDVRMLGNGRPFAIELVRPEKRHADLPALQEKINSSTKAIKVEQLQFVARRMVKIIDTAKADKTYRATIAAGLPIGAAALGNVRRLSGADIHQQTPERVAHRRADKVRVRNIRHLQARLPEGVGASNTFEIELTTEPGLYIKELISGDNGRTYPSVAGHLGTECLCLELDVTGVHFDPFSEE
ncbi:MAG: tRNA pseudouridine(54/55) synthase Pus10 [Planctomycetes bacterium]|nr:tRNA pseudouridine(54/55) synthase Pus10 [Planctomycetota bacterium]